MILEETFKLNNGVEIPKLGLGTWFIDDDKAAQAVRDAIDLGYRHIDTAEAYGNEHGVGEGVRTASVPRDEIFVTTKLAAEIKDYKGAAAAIDESLKKAGFDYYDLMLIHSPQPWTDWREGSFAEGNKEAWRALEDAYKAGKLRSIGLANFEKANIDNIVESCTVEPMANQILVHISNTPAELIEYSESQGMVVEGYSPIAHGVILDNPQIKAMAEKYGVCVAQLCIRYVLQLGCVALPKTANPTHMKTDAEVGFVISDEDMKALRDFKQIETYGQYSNFPVFSGK